MVASREEWTSNLQTRTWGPSNLGVYIWTQPTNCNQHLEQTQEKEPAHRGRLHLDPAQQQDYHLILQFSSPSKGVTPGPSPTAMKVKVGLKGKVSV